MRNARIAFIGCGSHATNNLYPVLHYARCDLVAACDLDEALAQRNARIFGAERAYTDLEQLLDQETLDGVIVVGPPELHYEAGKKVLRKGLPLFTEKPPASNLAQAEELVKLARDNGTFLMTGYMKRHGLPYAQARQMIATGTFEPAVGFFKYGHWATTDLNAMLHGMSCHIIDLALSFFGEVETVQSMLYQSVRALSLSVVLRFRSGRWAQLLLDASQPRIQERVELSGSLDGGNALLIIDNVQTMELHRQGLSGIDLLGPQGVLPLYEITPEFQLSDIQMWRPDYALPNMGQTRHFFQGFAGEIREFVNAILEQREPYPGIDDVVPALRIIHAILQEPNGTVHL